MILLIIQTYPQNPSECFISCLAERASVLRTETQAVHPSLHEYVKSLFTIFFNVSFENPSSLRQRRNRRSSPLHLLFQLPLLGIVCSNIIIPFPPRINLARPRNFYEVTQLTTKCSQLLNHFADFDKIVARFTHVAEVNR